jgi:N-acetyltransferase
LGVAQVWVSQHHRRQRVASQLLDAARAHAVYGHRVPLQQVAFSQPTRFGRAFALAYLRSGEGGGSAGQPQLLVY